MNPERFTHKTNEALAEAQQLALNSGHAQLICVPAAIALIADAGGIFPQAVSSVGGGDEAVNSFERVLHLALKKIPTQDPLPDIAPSNAALIKSIRRAQTLQKKKGDTHLAVDQLIIGLLEDSQIADCLKGAGISVARVKFELEKLRGGEGKKVESTSGDTNF